MTVAAKIDVFLENFQTALTPPPVLFLEIKLHFFPEVTHTFFPEHTRHGNDRCSNQMKVFLKISSSINLYNYKWILPNILKVELIEYHTK